MFPIRDTQPQVSFPIFNYLFIAVNVLIFIYQTSLASPDSFIYQFAFISKDFYFLDAYSYLTVFTSMFLHGGLFHLLSNMWFLHIFGDNIEGAFGHFKYVLFYLVCGIGAVGAQYLFDTESAIPMIGASGAISGVTGAYFAIFKHAKIQAIVPTLFGFIDIVTLPAWFFLGYWFFLQIFSGVGSLVTVQTATGGTAFFAHIGGFVVGYIIAKLLQIGQKNI